MIGRYPALHGLRGLAALAVVVTHVAFYTGNYTTNALGRAVARLDVSVALFFLLSGFLLTLPMFRAAAQGRPLLGVRAFLWRRAVRILPAYWVGVVLALLLLPSNRTADAVTWLRHLLLVQIYTPGWFADGLVQTWSLCTEVSFYVALPFLVRRLCGPAGTPWRPRRVLVAIGALSVAGWAWLYWASADPAVVGPLNLWLPSFASWFGAGIAMAVLVAAGPGFTGGARLRDLASSPGTCLTGAAAVYALACTDIAGPLGLDRPAPVEALVKNVLYLVIAVLMTAPLIVGDRRSGWHVLLECRPAVWFGEISYGVFLTHLTVLGATFAVLGRPPFTGAMPAALFLTLLVSTVLGALSYRCLEAPLLRIRSRSGDTPAAPRDTSEGRPSAT